MSKNNLDKNKQITKNQHFLPNFLIKRWKNEKNEILIINDLGEKNIIPFKENKKYFSQKFLYENTNTKSYNNLENKLAIIEQKYAKLTNEIIKQTQNNIALSNMNLNENDFALIELFTFLQMFRNKEYWELLNNDKDYMISYLDELIEAYFLYTKTSKKIKESLINDFQNERNKIESENLDWDKKEYKFFKLHSNPKYFLIHDFYFYDCLVIPFTHELLPIANMGKFKVQKNNDEYYFFLIPINPSIAILKKPKWSIAHNYKNFELFIENFGTIQKAIQTSKGMMYAELGSISRYSVAPYSFNIYDINSDYKSSFKNPSSMRVMNDKKKKNITHKNKWKK